MNIGKGLWLGMVAIAMSAHAARAPHAAWRGETITVLATDFEQEYTLPEGVTLRKGRVTTVSCRDRCRTIADLAGLQS